MYTLQALLTLDINICSSIDINICNPVRAARENTISDFNIDAKNSANALAKFLPKIGRCAAGDISVNLMVSYILKIYEAS